MSNDEKNFKDCGIDFEKESAEIEKLLNKFSISPEKSENKTDDISEMIEKLINDDTAVKQNDEKEEIFSDSHEEKIIESIIDDTSDFDEFAKFAAEIEAVSLADEMQNQQTESSSDNLFFTESSLSYEEKPLVADDFKASSVNAADDELYFEPTLPKSDVEVAKETSFDAELDDVKEYKPEAELKSDDEAVDIEATREFTANDIKEYQLESADNIVDDSTVVIDDDVIVNDIVDESANEDEIDLDEIKEEKSEKKEKKTNFFVRLIKALIPWKGDSAKEIIRKIVFIVAFVTLVAMLWQVAVYYIIDPMNYERDKNEIARLYNDETTDYSGSEINPKFMTLYNMNNDLVGWIRVNGTNIDYPVVKGDTNKEYERANFYHEYTRYGSIFMDSASSIEYGAESKNIVVYGHNMRDDSSMFSQLTHYRDLETYKKNPTFTFDTLYNDGTWKIFAVFTTNAHSAQDNGNYFEFRKSNFADANDFLSWIDECKLRSCINTTVDVNETDTILTLQSCVYEFTDARLVIMARRTRTGESKTVDVDGATYNENAKYPQAWYDAMGISNPYSSGTVKNDNNASALPVTNPNVTKQTVKKPTTTNKTQNSTLVDEDEDEENERNSGTEGSTPSSTKKPSSQPTTKKPSTTSSNNTEHNKPTDSQKPEPEPETEPEPEPETEPEPEPETEPNMD